MRPFQRKTLLYIDSTFEREYCPYHGMNLTLKRHLRQLKRSIAVWLTNKSSRNQSTWLYINTQLVHLNCIRKGDSAIRSNGYQEIKTFYTIVVTFVNTDVTPWTFLTGIIIKHPSLNHYTLIRVVVSSAFVQWTRLYNRSCNTMVPIEQNKSIKPDSGVAINKHESVM